MDDVRLSKQLSLVLRHRPDRIGISLDAAGWVDVDTLLGALAAHGTAVDRADLERVVADSDKQRFAIAGDRIRANQGHSVQVELGLAAATPPDVLFHGTPARAMAAIRREGLRPQKRHAVHLSADVETAHRVGARRGDHVVFTVAAGRMHEAGHEFTVSANGVWLVDAVPPEYLGAVVAEGADDVRRLVDEGRGD